ncbi:MAG: hypothetical protein ACQESF_00190 [Nanobdellota archaeon]
MQKKAQSEIVGLLVIVLIISFILLFVLNSVVFDEPESVKGIKNEKLASSMISAMLNTDTNCTPNSKVKDLLIDCGKWHAIGATDLRCYDGRTSCEYLNETGGVFEVMLNKTLGEWSRTYEFIVTEPQNLHNKIIHKTGGNLSAVASGGQAANQPLPVGRGYGTMVIWLCMGGCGEIA